MSDPRSLVSYDKSVVPEVTQKPEVASTANMMINSFKEFATSVNTISSEVSKEQAKQQRDILQHNISTTYRQLSDQSLNETDARVGLQNYDQSATDYQKQLIAQTSSFNKSYVQSLTDYYGAMHREPVFKNSMAYTQRQAQVTFATSDNQQTEDINTAIANGDINAALQLQAQQKVDRTQAFQKELIPYGEYERQEKESNANFTINTTIKSFKDSLVSGTTDQFWKDFKNIKTLSSKQLLDLSYSLDRAQSQFNNQLGYSKSDSVAKAENQIKLLQDGQATSFSTDVRQQYAATHTPYELTVMDRHAANAVTNSALVKLAMEKSPSEINKAIEDSKPKGDEGSETYKIDTDDWQKAKALTLAKRAEFEADPVKFLENDPTVKAAAQAQQLQQNAVGQIGDFKYTPFNVAKPDANDALAYAQSLRGISESNYQFLRNDKAKDYVTALQRSTPEQQIATFKALRDQYPSSSKYNAVIKQLTKNGLNKGYGALANFEPNDPDALQIVNALNQNTKDMIGLIGEPNAKVIDTTIDNTINRVSTSRFNPDKLQQYIDSQNYGQSLNKIQINTDIASTIKQLSYYALASGQEKTTQSAYNWAIDKFTSGMNFPSYNGVTLRVPKDIPVDNLNNYLKRASIDVMNYNFKLPDQFNREDLTKGVKLVSKELRSKQEEYFDEVIANGHFVTNKLNTGLVWVNSNGEYPTDKNNKPYEINYDQIRNYNFSGDVNRVQQDVTNVMLSGAREELKHARFEAQVREDKENLKKAGKTAQEDVQRLLGTFDKAFGNKGK